MNRQFQHRGSPRLNVSDSGAPGLPVIFQHGLGGDASQTVDAFPDEPGFRRITLECRGHGASEPGGLDALSIATFAGDLIALIESESHAPCVIGGISMGAAISLRIAATRPDLVRALVLARPAWVIEAGPENLDCVAEVGALLSEHDPETARNLFEQSPTVADFEANAPDNLASLRASFSTENTVVTAALLSKIPADGSGVTEAQVAAISVPTLILANRRDAVHPMFHATHLADLIAFAQLVEITPKADDLERHLADFRAAFGTFLRETRA